MKGKDSQLTHNLPRRTKLASRLSVGVPARHLTETAVLKVFSNIIDAIANGKIVSFHAVDHFILLQRLGTTFGFDDTIVLWLHSHLLDPTQTVYTNSKLTMARTVIFAVPQGSVLGPLLFIPYTADIGGLIR